MRKVSVIVPVYNTEKYLEKCLDSIAEQTLDDIEIVIVDDGSTDSSPEIIRQFKEKYSDRVKTFTQANAGQGKARNVGIDLSDSEYIGFVDSDDVIDLNMYSDMYDAAVKNDADLVECDYSYVNEKDERIPKYGFVRAYKDQKDMFHSPLVSPWNKLYRASILKKQNASNAQITFPEGLIYEDTSFFVKVIPEIKKFAFLDKEYVTHYLRPTSTMNVNKSKRVSNIFDVLQDTIDYYKNNDLNTEYSYELEAFCVRILTGSSLKRIAHIPDRSIRKDYMDLTVDFLNSRFPEYRKNPYIKKDRLRLYYAIFNRFTIKIFTIIFRMK